MKLTVQPAKILHFINQGYTINGVIHIGANDGEEVPSYKEMEIPNILCIEPIPEKYNQILERYPYAQAFNCAAGDVDRSMELKLTTDESLKGSSLLEDAPRDFDWPPPLGQTITVQVFRMDTLLSKARCRDYNCVVIDVQGFELQVLKGFGKLITEFNYWSIECSRVPVYKGGASGKEIVDFMASHGFIQDSPMEDHNDVFFISSKIKPVSDMVYKGGLEWLRTDA